MRHFISFVATLALLFQCSSLGAHATPLPPSITNALLARDGPQACPSYLLIQTRGTNEGQGPSSAFVIMNALTLSLVSGGNQYYTTYPALLDQISDQATSDIVTRVGEAIKEDPSICIALEGYSQGAAATVNALSQLTGASADAVKAVFLVGNPLHKPGLSCNIDELGGNSTVDSVGLQLNVFKNSNTIPDAFLNKTLDVCIKGDGICDSTNGFIFGAEEQHLHYPVNTNVQMMGNLFLTAIMSVGKFEKFVFPSATPYAPGLIPS